MLSLAQRPARQSHRECTGGLEEARMSDGVLKGHLLRCAQQLLRRMEPLHGLLQPCLGRLRKNLCAEETEEPDVFEALKPNLGSVFCAVQHCSAFWLL